MAEDIEGEAAGVFEVKMGDFLTRGDALAKIAELAAAGLKDARIEREDVVEAPSRPVWRCVDEVPSIPFVVVCLTQQYVTERS
ncbi:MAG: hypothetical protein M0C28_00875, partial [Candidatus Moduliflexus flocculans]|nr:hypothetical protein [Candidatus Moduliflexus flocculans]